MRPNTLLKVGIELGIDEDDSQRGNESSATI